MALSNDEKTMFELIEDTKQTYLNRKVSVILIGDFHPVFIKYWSLKNTFPLYSHIIFMQITNNLTANSIFLALMLSLILTKKLLHEKLQKIPSPLLLSLTT